jgi:S-adenosylmethionine/arginine decarboxylase-like enzyme
MKHLFLRLDNIQNVHLLKDAQQLDSFIENLLLDMNFHIVGKAVHQFKPFGATVVYLLAESHCSVHTFWEEGTAYIDVFCCTEFNHTEVIRSLCQGFDTQSENHTLMCRQTHQIFQ